MIGLVKKESVEEQAFRHAQKSSAWSEFRLSLEGFRAPTHAEVRRGADEFTSELLAEVLASEEALNAEREHVRQTVLECAAFYATCGHDDENSELPPDDLPPLIAERRRLSSKL